LWFVALLAAFEALLLAIPSKHQKHFQKCLFLTCCYLMIRLSLS
jgi:hypothetical protein